MSLKTKSKNTWGLVQLDETSKLYIKLRKKKQNPRLWKSDWRK